MAMSFEWNIKKGLTAPIQPAHWRSARVGRARTTRRTALSPRGYVPRPQHPALPYVPPCATGHHIAHAAAGVNVASRALTRAAQSRC